MAVFSRSAYCFWMARRNTRLIHNCLQLPLVFRRVKASVKRGCANHSLVLLLSLASLIDDDIDIAESAIHQVVVTDETCAIFKHQHLPAKLIRSSRLATSVQLHVRLK